MPVVILLELARNWLRRVQRRTFLNLLPRQTDFNVFRPLIDGPQRIRRNQNLPLRQPCPGIRHEIPNRPMPIIEVKFLDPSNFAVHCVQLIALQFFSRAQHRDSFG